jgi:putative SOS response-associated peptidase YedK
MCGRYALNATAEAIAAALRATPLLPYFDAVTWKPRYNIAPMQDAPIVVANMSMNKDGERRLTTARWGLVPFWSQDDSGAARLINARAESLATTPAFREAWKRGRCLVPATAFYEWMLPAEASKSKQPHAIALHDRDVFSFGGLTETWKNSEGKTIRTFSIVTVPANDLMRSIHDRMPLIVAESQRDRWLGAGEPTELLGSRPIEQLEAWPVSTMVNNWRNDVVECLERA